MYRSDGVKSLRSKMFVIAIVFFAFLGTALATPDTSSQGPVSSDNLKVYADPSSTSRTVTILTKGVHITILVEIEALGIEWCQVQLRGENEPLGYVNCSGIQRPTSQVSKAGRKNPVSITTPNPAVSDPISLERRPEQHSTPTTVATITPIVPTSPAPTSALSNSDIVSMTKVGLPSDVLVAKIKSSITKFDTSPAALSQLKTSGVADGVILAMVQAPSGASAPPVVQAAVNVPVVANASPASTTPPTGDGKTRVLVTDSQSWEMRGSGSAGGNANGWGASSYTSGGARPQTAEIIKTLNQRCPELIVTNNLAKADFVLTLDHEGGKGYLQRHNKIAVFNRDGDDIFSASTRELGSAVKDACQAMLRVNK